MKNYKTLIAELAEAMWPGSPEYKKKFGEPSSDSGSRHKIDRSSGVVRATRKYDDNSGESDEPTKSREDAAVAPAKRGRGRPPGKYGSYKKKVQESIEILEALETEEEIEEFIYSLDAESFSELEQFLAVDEAMSPQAKTTMKHVKNATPGEKKAAKDIKPGIAGYRDRVAMLKSAEARGGLKEAEVDEALKHPNHKVLDKNKNNKLDKEDFAILRGDKKAPMKEETADDSVAMLAAFITKQAKGEA